MKVASYSFRDLDKKWVLIENKKQIKKLVKNLKLEKTNDPLIGYFYIDQNEGFCLKVLGNIFKDEKDNLSLDDDYIYEDKIINYAKILNYVITILDNNITNYIKGIKAVEGSTGLIVDDKLKLRETRVITNIDSFRNNAYPDDVQVLLYSKDGDEEFLWANIEGIMKDEVFICKLLTSSENSKEHSEGTLVGVKFKKSEKEDEEDSLEVVGFLKRKGESV